MGDKFNALLSVSILPQIIDIIAKNERLSENDALYTFYMSETYEQLANEETKVWHYSPLMIYCIWKKEQETGEATFPEGL